MKAQQPEKKFLLKDREGDLSKKWYVEVLVGSRRVGKKYTGINQGKSPQERRRNADRLIRQLKKEARQIPASIDEQQLIYRHLEAERARLRKKSFQTYKSRIDQFFGWLDKRPLTTDVLRQYFQEYREVNNQSGTYDCRVKLGIVLNYAGLGHLIDPIKIKKGVPEPYRYFQKHQARQILEHLKVVNPQLYLYCLFIYYTGLRPRAELRKIRPLDIYWEEKKIRVPGEVAKNKKSQFVGLCQQFLPHIRPLQELPPGQYVFHKRMKKDEPAGVNTYGQWFREVLDDFGYSREYQLYSWRHTGAMRVYQATKDIAALQAWCRHSDIRTTQLYIRQLGLEDFRDFYDRFPPPY